MNRNEVPNFAPLFAAYWRANPMPKAPDYKPFVLSPEQAAYERDVRAMKQARSGGPLKRGGDLSAARVAKARRSEIRADYFAKTRISA